MQTEELSFLLSELKTDISWIKEKLSEADEKYAPMWVKYPVYGLSAGVFFWVLQQLLQLISITKALFY